MTRGPDKQFDRDEALGRAMQLFWQQGYEATGVTELLDAMGIGRQSMYDTFGNKRELFAEALDLYISHQVGAVRSMLRAPGSALDNLKRVMARWEQLGTEQDCGCLVGNTVAEFGPHDAEVGACLKRALEQLRKDFVATLNRAQADGEIGAHLDPEDLGNLLIVTVQGAALLSKVPDSKPVALGAMRALLSTMEAA